MLRYRAAVQGRVAVCADLRTAGMVSAKLR